MHSSRLWCPARRSVTLLYDALSAQSRCGNAVKDGGPLAALLLSFALINLCRADVRCDHDDIATVQYTESVAALAYEEAHSAGQGAVLSQAVSHNPAPLTIEWDFTSIPAATPDFIRWYLEKTVAPSITSIVASYLRIKYSGLSVGMNPCTTYYPTPGAHSRDNPYRCASMDGAPTCGGSVVNPKHLLYYQICTSYSSCGAVAGEAGSSHSLVMYMQYNPSSSSCRSTTVAYAAYCSKGDLGRPTVAYMNWCSRAQLVATESLLNKHLEVGVHEVLHALGFSAGLWRRQQRRTDLSYFLQPDGSGYLPYTDVIAEHTIRNETGSFIISPTAVREARRHSGCMSLPGVQLESSGGARTAGSHLEDYQYYGDVMCGWVYSTGGSSSPTSHGQAVMSAVTLAILEDTGYYLVNLDQAGQLSWGHGAGCDFATRTCTEMRQVPDQSWFLSSPGAGCTRDRLQIAVAGASGLGCYSKHRGVSKAHRCAKEGAMQQRGGFGETVGHNSRCLEHSRSVRRTLDGTNYASSSRLEAGCYAVTCKPDGTLSILIDGKGEVPCPSTATIVLPTYLGYQSDEQHPNTIDCPDSSELCGTAGGFPGEVTCGDAADCRERGVCTGGRCRCMLLHSGSDCSALRYGIHEHGDSSPVAPPPPVPPTPMSTTMPGPPGVPTPSPVPEGSIGGMPRQEPEYSAVKSGWSRCRSVAGPDCAGAGQVVRGERYQTVRCKHNTTGRFVDLDLCGEQESLQFELCALSACTTKEDVQGIVASAWSPCSAQCTRAADSFPPSQSRSLTCQLGRDVALVYDPSGMTERSVSAELLERECGYSLANGIATRQPCNVHLCDEGRWTTGAWGECVAQCSAVGVGVAAAQGTQQRTVQCEETPCLQPQPSAIRSCSLTCDACEWSPCGIRGECQSVWQAGAAVARCECMDSYSGQFCRTTPQCDGSLFTSALGGTECCPSGQYVSAAGSCCSPGSALDTFGECCAAGMIDACGTCAGTGVGFDRTGQCCTGYLTEDLLCCPEPLDRCGACGDGTSCNTQVVMLLGDVSDAVLATIIDTILDLLCAYFGYASRDVCPLTVSTGSAALPASRQLRLRAKQRGLVAMSDVHAASSGASMQGADVGLRVLQAWAEARGAIAVASAAAAAPALWGHVANTAGRGLLDSGQAPADVLELSVEFNAATALQLNVSQGVTEVSLGGMQYALESVAPELQASTGTSLLKSSFGIAPMCGNRMCEAGEVTACPTDCLNLRNCPAAGSESGGTSRPCGGHGACNYLQGACNCSIGYTGEACYSCDTILGYFWDEQLFYCHRAHQSGLTGTATGPDVNRSSGLGVVTLITVICSSVLLLIMAAAWIWKRYRRSIARRDPPRFPPLFNNSQDDRTRVATDVVSHETVSIH
eukprot:jgi/Ulvmu1/4875/UM020_0161.1